MTHSLTCKRMKGSAMTNFTLESAFSSPNGVATRKTNWHPAMAGAKVAASKRSASNNRSRSAAPGTNRRSSPVFSPSSARGLQNESGQSERRRPKLGKEEGARAPVFRSVACTVYPLSRSFLTSQEPMNPAPPVTHTRTPLLSLSAMAASEW